MQGAPFSREHARQGGGTGLVLQLPRAAPRWPALQGAPAGEQGRREAWALGLLVPREQDIAAEQEHVETGGRR